MKEVFRQRLKYIICDYLTLNVGWLCFNLTRFYSLPLTFHNGNLHAWLTSIPVLSGQFIVPIAAILLYAISGYYNKSNTLYKSRLDELLNTLLITTIASVGIFFTTLINDKIPDRLQNYELITTLFLCLLIPTYIARLCITTYCAEKIRRGRYVLNTFIIGDLQIAKERTMQLVASSKLSGLKVVGIIDTSSDSSTVKHTSEMSESLPVYTSYNIKELCDELNIQALIVTPQIGGIHKTAELINSLYPLERSLFVTPDLHQLIMTRPKVSSVITEPLVDITNANISPATINLKRLGDIVVSSIALLFLIPIFAVIAIIIKLDSHGPCLYRQQRIGYHKKPFYINKFRTMYVDAENNGPALSTAEDPRITRIGRTLRKYRLDELPQFWNVLIGEMSLVGPRPERKFYIDQIVKRIPAYSLIHQVRPGITSWGMVRYGYASNIDEMIERLRYDLLYIENVSLGVDLKNFVSHNKYGYQR